MGGISFRKIIICVTAVYKITSVPVHRKNDADTFRDPTTIIDVLINTLDQYRETKKELKGAKLAKLNGCERKAKTT